MCTAGESAEIYGDVVHSRAEFVVEHYSRLRAVQTPFPVWALLKKRWRAYGRGSAAFLGVQINFWKQCNRGLRPPFAAEQLEQLVKIWSETQQVPSAPM